MSTTSETTWHSVPIRDDVLGELKRFIWNFYSLSDDREENAAWVECFSSDPAAIVEIGDRSAGGFSQRDNRKEALTAMREDMWKDVARRVQYVPAT